MTRKKWNKLRRHRPELFTNNRALSFERMHKQNPRHLKAMSREAVIAQLTAFVMTKD